MRAWVTRHTNGMLSIHTQKPRKVRGTFFKEWRSPSPIYINEEDLPEGVHPRYDDEEPTEVEIIIKAMEK